jgi:tRNA threonylcarbamoyl adenosine modification protein YeaZ
MKELVIDGSFEDINLSIFNQQELIYNLHMHSPNTHSKILTDILDCAFKPLSLNIQDIERTYCCIGPGKYTSLRVTLATIKGMFFGKTEYVYGVCSLDLMAAEQDFDKPFRIVCETSKTKIYFADYEYIDGYVERLSDVESSTMEEALKTTKKIVRKNTVESTKNIFKINKEHIKRANLYELAPIY